VSAQRVNWDILTTHIPQSESMPAPIEPLSTNILALMYFGDVVFALSGALLAGRKRMDVIGFVLIGTITGIGGGTVRDLLLGRTVWWTQEPLELVLCVGVSLITFFVIPASVARRKWMIWCDALGLAAFSAILLDIRMGPPGEFMRVGPIQIEGDNPKTED
jgi:uncharacterized membrane protein YeiH